MIDPSNFETYTTSRHDNHTITPYTYIIEDDANTYANEDLCSMFTRNIIQHIVEKLMELSVHKIIPGNLLAILVANTLGLTSLSLSP